MQSWKLVALGLTALFAATLGCSSSSTTTSETDDAGGGGSQGGGTSGYACNVPASHFCYNYTDIPSADESAVKAACSAESGTEASSCSTSDVAGCCTNTTDGYTTEECFYTGNGSAYTAAIVKQACPSPGKFSTSP